MENEIFVSSEKLSVFIKSVLLKARVREDVAEYVTEGLVQTSLRGVDSHGVRLLPHYMKGVKGGRINPNPNYKFIQTFPSTGLLDADHTFGHAAGMEAVKRVVENERAHVAAGLYQAFDEMAADKPSPACNKDFFAFPEI